MQNERDFSNQNQQLSAVHNSMFLWTAVLQDCILSVTDSIAWVRDREHQVALDFGELSFRFTYSSLMADLDFSF